MMLIGIAIIAVLSLYIVAQFIVPDNKTEKYYDYNWSHIWTKKDKEARKEADCKPITTIHRKLGKLNPHIWIVPDSCEQGLPHTRSIDIIAIPKSYPKDRLEKTLEHELIHLYQRSMPDSWRKFYRIKWNYELYSEPPIGISKDLIEDRRSNPDTADSPWVCWRNRYWAIPVYTDINNLSLSKAIVKWYDSSISAVSLKPPEEWVLFFGLSVYQMEHPHEISAEFLAGPLRRMPNCDDLVEELPENASPAMRILDDSWRYDEMYPLI